ncbi:DUF1934 domain-containing protein [Luxibacter massiliensis]|uniref:DUF1934 domain-containing protein n=1 Tax=Luxibacter massiliensis TaxID=2219695 RepID=UPI000F04B862|nr:DUF1934 domain-containing protein [Luxibacter massiliensis]
MTKDVLISISGLHAEMAPSYTEDEREAIEVVTPANYYCKNGKHYVVYDEVVEGMAGTIKNRIKITGSDSLEIVKTGLTNTRMVFEKNKKNLTYYETPYGQMLVGVNTRDMKVNVADDNIGVSIAYELDINHEPMADCTLRMKIHAKGAYPFS